MTTLRKKLIAGVIIALMASGVAVTLSGCGSDGSGENNAEVAYIEGFEQVGEGLYRDEASDVLWVTKYSRYFEMRVNADGSPMTYTQYKQMMGLEED